MTDVAAHQHPVSSPASTGGLADWMELWYEPWRQMHAGWWSAAPAPGLAPGMAAEDLDSAWTDRLSSSTPLLRAAYRWFCHRFDLPADAPLPIDRWPATAEGLALDVKSLDRAALALGRVAHASHCLGDARRDLAHLFSTHAGQAPQWRDALRQARARPLHAQGTPPPAGGGDADLRRWALPLMGRLIDDALPGAWPRLRLRVDPTHLGDTAPLPPMPGMAAGVRRQAWRIWRVGAAVTPLASDPSQ